MIQIHNYENVISEDEDEIQPASESNYIDLLI